ncbi:MAG: glycosyltransferase [Patescibacteria group bacterium]|jgi:glycosyltransferase involved in cell wall biosynthesis
MKIVIASESYLPTISGVSVFARYLALGMQKRGHEVHVICPSTKMKSLIEMDGDVTVHRIRSRKNPFRSNHRNTIFSYRIIRKLLREIHPDVIHLQDPLGTCVATLRMAKKLDIPVVMTNHFAFDYILSYLPLLKPVHPQVAKIIEKYLVNIYNRCDYITFPSATIRNKFNHPKLTTPAIVISNGVNLEQFFPSFNFAEIKKQYHIPDKQIVLHVGRLDQDKSSEMVIETFIKLRQKHDIFMVVCGEGNRKDELIKRIQEAGESKNIAFIGFINHQTELPQFYQMSSVFVTGSNIETQGIVALEAMASELPLVVPNAGALPELVQNGVNGYIFKPGDVDDMAEKIEQILANKKIAKEMGVRSLEMVEEHEIEKSYDNFESIYNKVTNK